MIPALELYVLDCVLSQPEWLLDYSQYRRKRLGLLHVKALVFPAAAAIPKTPEIAPDVPMSITCPLPVCKIDYSEKMFEQKLKLEEFHILLNKSQQDNA
jgi:hypothetical protein